MGNLSRLELLALSQNPLDTTIPASFGSLSGLKVLLAWNCGIKGTIPSELGDAANLRILDLADNSLIGGFPASFGQLIHLERLTARNNQLDSTLPPEMGDMTSLEILDFPNNKMAGEIPKEFGRLINLQELIGTNNLLGGTLADELGDMTEMVIFDLTNNQIEGEIPSSFAQMTKLEQLLLGNNRLLGKIPAIFDGMNSLATVDLSNNTLVGDAPQGLAEKQSAGVSVNLASNYLAGSVLKTMQNQEDNFIDGQTSLQHKLYIQSTLQLDIGATGNLYTLFRNDDARTNRQSAKPKLPVGRYTFTIVSGDDTAVEMTSDEFGYYIKPIAEIKIAAPVVVEIVLAGNEGTPHSVIRVNVVTEKAVTTGPGNTVGTTPPSAPLPVHEGYILGFVDGTVRPNDFITRAEYAMILYRIYDDQGKDASVFKQDPFPDVALGGWSGFAISYVSRTATDRA